MSIGKKLREIREKRRISLGELSKLTGISKSSLQRYETEKTTKIPIDIIPILEKSLNLPTGYLMGWNGNKTSSVRIPVLGCVAAGVPIDAIENIVDWEEIPESMAKDGEYFGVIIQGDSMEPRICDGDIAIVRVQPDVESGEIAIVLINGENGTCKKILKDKRGLTLVSFNPRYDPMFFTCEDVETLPVVIRGKVVKFIVNV